MLPVLFSLAGGILLDRFLETYGTFFWLTLSATASVSAFLAFRMTRVSTVFIFLSIMGLGAAWSHRRWSDLDDLDISRSVGETPQPVWLHGLIVDSFGFRPGRSPEESGSTRFVIETLEVHNADGLAPCSGLISAVVNGNRSELRAGAPVEMVGSLDRVPGPLNPGEFDYRDYLRAEGIQVRLRIDESSAIWTTDSLISKLSLIQKLRIGLGRIREVSRRQLTEDLDPETAAVASALLLGRREGVDPELVDAFAQTGTTHLLAISGLHLQALALALLWILRKKGVNRRGSFALVGVATLAYAILVGLMPSVSRSAAMTLSVCAAGILSRRDRPANTLAAAGIVTLALNPSFLFDLGCQLSFLAIIAIFWNIMPILKAVEAWRTADPLDVVEAHYASTLTKRVARCRKFLTDALVGSTLIWSVALPLTSWKFHLISPIGILLNIPLIPLTSFALVCSCLKLIFSFVSRPFESFFGGLTHFSLKSTVAMVRWGERQLSISWYVAEPSHIWVLGFYVIGFSAVAAWAGRRSDGLRRVSTLLFLVWTLGGIALSLISMPAQEAKAEVLAVGHGLAVIIETTPGHAILYDCGRMRDPSVGRRIISPALWARGISRLDAVIVSHGDADHYNGLSEILERFPIKEIIVSEHFESSTDSGVVQLLNSIRERKIPIRRAVEGTTWKSLDDRLRFTILHPVEGFSETTPDNARSLLIDVESSGRHLLLTGDLEGLGMNAVLAKPLGNRPDVFLSPHHGGRTANPISLYEWADPKQVVVSQRSPLPGTRDPLETLPYPLRRTWKQGALRLIWTKEGITIRGFLDP